jgi:hypothetical protein
MSSFMKMTLEEAIPQIEKLFESFGVKSIIIQRNNEWTSAATVIQLTRRNVDSLSAEYRYLEENLGKIDDNDFKITLQVRPIQEFKNVIKELQTGYLKIGEISAKILVNNFQAIASQRMGRGGFISRIGEYAEFEFYCVTMGMDQASFSSVLADLDAFVASMGFQDRDELVRSWLGLETFYQANTFSILVPVYATIGEIQYQGGNEIKVSLKVDERLFDSSHVWLTRSPQGDRAPIIERAKYELSSGDKVPQDGFFYITIRHRFASIGVNDKISVSLINRKLGLLFRKGGWAFQFPSEGSDPFLKVFSLFDAGKNMEDLLLHPKEPEDLVAAFSWLLEMIGITSLQLGQYESVREEKTEKGSADIIACYRESTSSSILAIDCTIGVPGEHKIDKIKNTAEYISRKIGIPVEAVIVTSEKSSTTKELGQKHSVKILDSTDLDQMIGFYKKGHAHPARQIVLS